MNRYPPECPFCGRVVEPPSTIRAEFGEVLGGTCTCGSVYVCDPTGHNTGEAYMEALALARGDWNIGSMDQEVDYRVEDRDYDLKSHQRVFSKGLAASSGKLVFVRIEAPGREGVPPARHEGAERSTAPEGRGGGRKLKGRVRGFLGTRSLDKIAALALEDKGVIRLLISLSYDKEDVLSWRAMEALGSISRAFSRDRVEVVRDTIRRLLWSMGEESGGIGWSAAEMLGEIVAGNPDALADIIPLIWSYREEEMFRPGILWAMGRIASVRPDFVRFILEELPSFLEDPTPSVRGYAAWVLGILGGDGTRERIGGLRNDPAPVPFYRDGSLAVRTVGEIVAEVLH